MRDVQGLQPKHKLTWGRATKMTDGRRCGETVEHDTEQNSVVCSCVVGVGVTRGECGGMWWSGVGCGGMGMMWGGDQVRSWRAVQLSQHTTNVQATRTPHADGMSATASQSRSSMAWLHR